MAVALDGVNSRKFIVELKEFVRTARDVASEVLVIIRSYRSYTAAGVEYVTLMALDEAECKTYVDLHPNSGYVTQDDIAYGFIHEQTAGYPERIDRLLLRLKSIDLTELMAFGSWAIDEGQGLPEYLDRAFKKIAEDEGSDEYCLLKGLSIFSFGESLETLKRFEGARRIRPSAIDKLVNSSLADPADNFEVGLQRGEQQRYIVVKKSVQDHLLFCLGERQLAKAYEDAVSVYFGRDWRLRNYQLSSSFQMAVRRLNSVAEQNASIILTRFVTDEIENIESTEKSILDRIAVLQFYLQKLDAGDRYLFVTRLVKVLLPKLEPYEDNHLVRDIRFRYARALRMLGQHDQSIREFKKLSEVKNDVRTRARIYLNLAYSYKSKGDHASALQYVDRILGLKCKGESVYAAESIKYLLVGGVDKSKRLHELVEKARKDKCHVAANNIEIDLVDEISGEPQQLEGYKRLMSVTRKTADEYNYFDTVSKYCSLAVKLGVPLSAKGSKAVIGFL